VAQEGAAGRSRQCCGMARVGGAILGAVLKLALIIALPFCGVGACSVFFYEHGGTPVVAVPPHRSHSDGGVITAYAVWIARSSCAGSARRVAPS